MLEFVNETKTKRAEVFGHWGYFTTVFCKYCEGGYKRTSQDYETEDAAKAAAEGFVEGNEES